MFEILKKTCELNDLSLLHSHLGTSKPSLTQNVALLTNAVYDQALAAAPGRSLHIIRNPLSIIVSAYYSHLNTHPTDRWPELVRQRQLLREVNREQGLFLTLAFIESPEFYRGTPGPLAALKTWNFDDANITTVRMEDLTKNTRAILEDFFADDTLLLPDLSHYTFEKMSGGRRVGERNDGSHYRSGREDDWRQELPPAIISYARAHYRHVLERFYPTALE